MSLLLVAWNPAILMGTLLFRNCAALKVASGDLDVKAAARTGLENIAPAGAIGRMIEAISICVCVCACVCIRQWVERLCRQVPPFDAIPGLRRGERASVDPVPFSTFGSTSSGQTSGMSAELPSCDWSTPGPVLRSAEKSRDLGRFL